MGTVTTKYLTRAEAAEYLRNAWGSAVAATKSTLETLAVRGGGPRFHPIKGGRVGYTQDDLDCWANGRIRPAVSSTSEAA